MENISLSSEKVVGIAALLWGANFIAAEFFRYPFLYCWLSPVATELYMAWGRFALVIIILMVAVKVLTSAMVKAISWLMLGVFVIELPRIADYMFRLGVSCE